MLHVEPHPRPAPPAAALAALLRARHTAAAEAEAEGLPPLLAAAEAARLEPVPDETPVAEWLSRRLAQQRGVVCAFPERIWSVRGARVGALAPRLAVGRNGWWMWRLRAANFSLKDSYSPDAKTAVYRTDGLQLDPDWFPREDAYDCGLSAEEFERASAAGIAVCVREVPPSAASQASASLRHVPHVTQRLALELEAAAAGVAPAVFACFAVHDADSYAGYERVRLEAASPAAPPEEHGDGSRVVACVTVSQTHSFRLADMLDAINHVAAEPLVRVRVPVASMRGTLHEATTSVARKLRALAENGVLKLNVAPDNVVFVPRLEEGEEGEFQATGFGFTGADGEPTKGVPFLADFDPALAKRCGGEEGFDADCAYAAMALVLLSSARAQFGEVYRPMLHRLTGKSAEGAALPPEELPERFEEELSLGAALRRAREGGRLAAFERVVAGVAPDYASQALAPCLAQAGADLVAVAEARALEGAEARFDPARPVCEELVRTVLRSEGVVDALLFAPPRAAGEDAPELEVEKRLAAVRLARGERMRARAELRA